MAFRHIHCSDTAGEAELDQLCKETFAGVESNIAAEKQGTNSQKQAAGTAVADYTGLSIDLEGTENRKPETAGLGRAVGLRKDY